MPIVKLMMEESHVVKTDETQSMQGSWPLEQQGAFGKPPDHFSRGAPYTLARCLKRASSNAFCTLAIHRGI